MSQAAQKRLGPKRDWESFVKRQVTEQTAEHAYPLQRKLDFVPFEGQLALGAMRMDQLEALTQSHSIAQLQARMAAGELSSLELTQFYLQRIRQHNPQLRAYLELNPHALTQAQARDAERAQGQLRGPLHGIPLCLKDNIAATGMHNTAGAAVLYHHQPRQNAFIVERLLEAGAVILGKNNLSEWANFMSSQSVNGYSTLGGHTRNPYGPFDVGGSSSGTASAVAANLAVAGIGSETSGSLIYPAAQNGICTLKPTFGLVSRHLIIPITAAQDTAGPMTKHPEDLAVLMQVLAAPDAQDPLTQMAQGFGLPSGLMPQRVGWFNYPQREGDTAALLRVVAALEALGLECIELPFPEESLQMMPVLHAGMRDDLPRYLEAAEAQIGSLQDVLAYNLEHPQAMAYGQDLLEISSTHPLSAEEYAALVEHNRQQGHRILESLMEAAGATVLLTISNSLSVYTSTSGFPVVNFPAGYRDCGEPVGASLVGQPLADGLLIELSQRLSQQLSLRQPPKLEP